MKKYQTMVFENEKKIKIIKIIKNIKIILYQILN